MRFFIFQALLVSTAALSVAHAEDPSYPVVPFPYSNDFSESKLGPEWQIVFANKNQTIVDGVMVAGQKVSANHSSIYQLKFEPYADVDMTVEFRLRGAEWFKISMRDIDYKPVHAGHICNLRIFPDKISMIDEAAGGANLANKEKRKNKDPGIQAYLKTKIRDIPYSFDQDRWYRLHVTIKGDIMSVDIDGKRVGEFQSESFAYPTKKRTTLGVKGKHVDFDNLEIH